MPYEYLMRNGPVIGFTIEIEDPTVAEPGLLLSAAFVVRGLAEDANTAAGAGASAADLQAIVDTTLGLWPGR